MKFTSNRVPPTRENYKHLMMNSRALILEIGSGTGDFAIDYARRHPEKFIFAV